MTLPRCGLVDGSSLSSRINLPDQPSRPLLSAASRPTAWRARGSSCSQSQKAGLGGSSEPGRSEFEGGLFGITAAGLLHWGHRWSTAEVHGIGQCTVYVSSILGEWRSLSREGWGFGCNGRRVEARRDHTPFRPDELGDVSIRWVVGGSGGADARTPPAVGFLRPHTVQPRTRVRSGPPSPSPAGRWGTHTWEVTPCGPGIRLLSARVVRVSSPARPGLSRNRGTLDTACCLRSTAL